MYGVAGILIVLLAFFLGRRQATEVTFMRGLKKGFHPQGRFLRIIRACFK